MNKNTVIVLLLIASLSSIGYIVYDEFVKEEKVELKECNKEELCDECNCSDDFENIQTNEDGNYRVEHSGIYTKDGNIYKLDVYKEFNGNVKIENIKLNNEKIDLEIKDYALYVNGKKVASADEIYVTNNHIFVGSVAQSGLIFNAVIDSKGNVIDLEDNEKINYLQANEIYLSDKGNLVVIGSGFCGLECTLDKEIVEFSFANGKLELTKRTK